MNALTHPHACTRRQGCFIASTVSNNTEASRARTLDTCAHKHEEGTGSTNSPACTQVWDEKISDIEQIGTHGNVEHLRDSMKARGVRNIRLAANELLW